jgi:hypothetical protein
MNFNADVPVCKLVFAIVTPAFTTGATVFTTAFTAGATAWYTALAA